MKFILIFLSFSFWVNANETLTVNEFKEITGFTDGVYILNEMQPHSDECLGAGEMIVTQSEEHLSFVEEASHIFEIVNIGGTEKIVQRDGSCTTEFQPSVLNKTTKILTSVRVRTCYKGKSNEVKAEEQYEIIFTPNQFVYKLKKKKTGEKDTHYSCTLVSESVAPEIKEPIVKDEE